MEGSIYFLRPMKGTIQLLTGQQTSIVVHEGGRGALVHKSLIEVIKEP